LLWTRIHDVILSLNGRDAHIFTPVIGNKNLRRKPLEGKEALVLPTAAMISSLSDSIYPNILLSIGNIGNQRKFGK
jgi:hypothetical protein